MEVTVSLLQRLGYGQLSNTISFDEIGRWSPQVLSILLEEKLVEPTIPAKIISCPGCPENCFKSVHTLGGRYKPLHHFIACDETDYMGNITLRPEHLLQWQISSKLVASWVAKKLGFRTLSPYTTVPGELGIGLLLKDKYHCQIVLSSIKMLSLKINQISIPLLDILLVEHEHISIDQVTVDVLAKQSMATPPKPEYQPSILKREARKLNTQRMYADWHKAYRLLRKEHPGKSDVWYSQQISKKKIAQNRTARTIRKHLKI